MLGIATTLQLDREYLREWAPKLGVAELLEQAVREAGQIHGACGVGRVPTRPARVRALRYLA